MPSLETSKWVLKSFMACKLNVKRERQKNIKDHIQPQVQRPNFGFKSLYGIQMRLWKGW